MLTAKELRNELHYDLESGIFRWLKPRQRRDMTKPAGGIIHHGYSAICINGRKYLAHRLAWLYVHGQWPTEEIDHVNGNTSDNRLANLREASRQQNCRNAKARPSRSGVKGVAYWTDGKSWYWVAQVFVNRKRAYQSYHKTIAAAAKAYAVAAKEYHGNFASTRS
jgi:hypothetical protein